MCGFFRYMGFRRGTLRQDKNVRIFDVGKIVGAEWKKMTSEEQKKWSTWEPPTKGANDQTTNDTSNITNSPNNVQEEQQSEKGENEEEMEFVTIEE